MDVNHLLKDLKIAPSRGGIHTSTASQVRSLTPQSTRTRNAATSNVRTAPTYSPASRLTDVQAFLDARKATVDPVASLVHQAKDDSAWDMVGDVFKKAVEIVDVPRSYVVSGVKELSDLANEGAQALGFDVSTGETGASWSDFVHQGQHHIGFGDVVHAQSRHARDGNKWIGRAAGFAGDFALDPLTHTAFAAKGGGEALEGAIKAGGRKEVSEGVARQIAQKFPGERVFESGADGTRAIIQGGAPEGADQLIADAARKGRGALTKKGLEKSGSTELAKALDIPQMRYELLGVGIPGSSHLAEATANLKGSLKEWVGGTKAAKILRAKRIPETNGMLAFTNIIRDATGNPETQAAAVKAMMNATEKTAITRKAFDRETQMLIKSDLGTTLKNPPKDLIHLSESPGVQTPLNDWLDHMHEVNTSMGVNIPKRDNYVPHLVTKEARDMGRSNEVVKAVVDSIDKPESIQLARELEGTIAEENAKFYAKHGVKLFEDDPAVIATTYLDRSERAVKRAQIQQGLADFGVATEIGSAPVTQKMGQKIITAEDARDGLASSQDIGKSAAQVVKETKKSLKDTQKLETAALKKGVSLKEQAAIVATAGIKDQKSGLYERINTLDRQIKDISARRTMAEKGVTDLSKQVEALSKKRDGWIAIAKRERHPLQKEAQARIAKLNRTIAKTTDALETEKGKLDYIVNRWTAEGKVPGMVPQARGFADEVKRLTAEREGLNAQLPQLSAEHDALKLTTTPPGAGALLSDAHVAEANRKLEELAPKISRAKDSVDITTHVFDSITAEKEALVPIVDDSVKELDAALAKLPKGKTAYRSNKKLLEHGAEVSNNLRLARDILATADDPASKLMAQFEASASMADAKAVIHGTEADSLQATLDSMHDPKFRTYLKQFIKDGHQRMNETYQIPDWADQALQAERVLNSPAEWGDWAKGYDKTLNVLKGYMVARPGFVVRNAYSSMFNVYLEGGARALESVREYKGFYKLWKKDPEGYLATAVEKYGPEKAGMLDRALTAQAASGFGQAASEFHVGAFGGLSANPLSSNFAPIRAIRKGNEAVEEVVRGGHAYDVLKRGGSDNLAVDTIEKWHFNYSDITDFDRKMKRVMPFWAFFSNNVALQAQTFPQILPKLNRTYFNLQRNLESGTTEDTSVPSYFKDSMPIRLPGGGGPGTNVKYLMPDLPALQVVKDLSGAINSKGLSLVAQTTPPLKILNDAVLGDKNSYTGKPFQDKYDTTPFPLPGFLPGVDEGGNSGKSVWTDRTAYTYENLLPTMSQADRFGDGKNRADSLLSFMGIGVRTNNDKTRKGEELRRAKVQQDQLARARQLGKV